MEHAPADGINHHRLAIESLSDDELIARIEATEPLPDCPRQRQERDTPRLARECQAGRIAGEESGTTNFKAGALPLSYAPAAPRRRESNPRSPAPF
jgi:hypothetical protein